MRRVVNCIQYQLIKSNSLLYLAFCQVCDQRFMNNSALSCHKKIHSNQKYYNCPLCHEGFDQINMLRAHAERHLDPATGVFSCPWCHKSFDTFASARRHARAFHSLTTYTCPDCGKSFPRPDKLKLHRLRHSSHREFMCETCGRQFKRKVKLNLSAFYCVVERMVSECPRAEQSVSSYTSNRFGLRKQWR